MTVGTVLLLLLVGVIAGSVAASLGVGGGIIYVPALVAIFGLAQHEAEGTSLAVIVPSALIAAIVHARAGRVDWRTAALLAVGALGGGFLGARAALATDPLVLQRLFGVLVAITALRMLRKTRRRAHETPD
jgi:uncharacterized membrane protein YfcA